MLMLDFSGFLGVDSEMEFVYLMVGMVYFYSDMFDFGNFFSMDGMMLSLLLNKVGFGYVDYDYFNVFDWE